MTIRRAVRRRTWQIRRDGTKCVGQSLEISIGTVVDHVEVLRQSARTVNGRRETANDDVVDPAVGKQRQQPREINHPRLAVWRPARRASAARRWRAMRPSTRSSGGDSSQPAGLITAARAPARPSRRHPAHRRPRPATPSIAVDSGYSRQRLAPDRAPANQTGPHAARRHAPQP